MPNKDFINNKDNVIDFLELEIKDRLEKRDFSNSR